MANEDKVQKTEKSIVMNNGGNFQQPKSDSPASPALSAGNEIFCNAYAVSGDSSKAWKLAFGADGGKSEIKALLALPDVSKRIDSLRAEHLELMQQSSDVNVDLLVRKLELARKLAMKNDEAAAATAAIMAMAKLHGLLVDKREMSLKRPEQMTEKELLAVLGFETVEEMLAADRLTIEHQPIN